MQTFLPYPSFKQSAKALDMKRLGKQRVEAYQILRCLAGEQTGWKNHPAVKMWKGHEMSLIKYAAVICDEWVSRGYKDTIRYKLEPYVYISILKPSSMLPPEWLGNTQFHNSHKSNLLRKKPEYYNKFGWSVDSTLPYVWPV